MNAKDLQARQKWTLNQKIDHSLYVIESFISRLNGEVYVSFSGGKDSTVLLDLCRRVKPDVMAVFCNTGNEFPDIVQFVRGKVADGENVKIIRPAMNPKKVIEKYGFPIHSKVMARKIYYARKQSRWAVESLNKANSKYALNPKFQYLLNVQYDISDFCCRELKKNPFARFEKETGLHPIIGTMADESLLRQTQYLRRGGCNTFDNGKIESTPLAIWTESDIWQYIQKNDINIAGIYAKGARRTGCMFCGYGCHLANEKNRFRLVHELYPKWYDHFMNYQNNGVTYREALREILKVNNMYLPDEDPNLKLF